MTYQTTEPRTYGGWRRRRGVGLFGLGTAGTFAALGVLVALILVASVSMTAVAVAAPPIVAAGGLAMIRVHGASLAWITLRRLRWWYGSLRGHTQYRAGVVVDHPRAFQLPGVLAPTTLLSAEDGYGGHYGLVWDRRTGYLTATLRVVSASTWLANRADADAWIANWGGWLASLGYVPTLRWVTVTVDSAPEPGSTLADTVGEAVDPSAPKQAQTIMEALVGAAPAVAADVDTRVSLTFDPKASPAAPRDLTDAVAELGRTLEGLESALGACGVTVLGRATAAEVAGAVRKAFDPAARGEINHILAQARRGFGTHDLSWADAGPVGAEEHVDHYRHDSGVSVTWAWHEAPRSNVHADILGRLVAPGAWAKRVSLQYRPFPAADATRVLESEVNAATFREHYRRRTGRDETARDTYYQARAHQAASEEAAGSGVCLVSLFTTVTVTDESELPRAVADVEAAAEASKIRLRRMWGSQAPGFATTLPCGTCPAELSRRWKH